MIKLIASDMDGTLLNNEHVISKENAQAIKLAQEKGIHFMLATGREYKSVKKLMDRAGFVCPCILMNGSQIRDQDGKITKNIELDKDKVRQICEILQPYELVINYMTQNGIVVTDDEAAVFKDFKARAMHYSPEQAIDLEENIQKQAEFFKGRMYMNDLKELLASDHIINKIETFYPDEAEVTRINDKLRQIPGLAVASAGPSSIEVTNVSAQKGHILEEYIKKIGIKKEEVMVLGDSNNDISMFEKFTYSFAPDNATAAIKDMAYEVVEANHEHGVGKAILRMLNNNPR